MIRESGLTIIGLELELGCAVSSKRFARVFGHLAAKFEHYCRSTHQFSNYLSTFIKDNDDDDDDDDDIFHHHHHHHNLLMVDRGYQCKHDGGITGSRLRWSILT